MRKRGFTLVELLAVVAIMAIILMAAVPVFQTLGKRDVNSAAYQLRTTLRLARQAAVTQRRCVYVVFPDNRYPYTSETLQYCLRSYACLSCNPKTCQWEYLTDWKFLPKGVYFLEDTALTGNVFRTFSPVAPFPREDSTKRTMPSVCFEPSGRASFGGTNETDVTIYFSTARFYTTNASGTALVAGPNIPGITNSVRVRVKTGQVDLRFQEQY